MDITVHLDALRRDGILLADAAAGQNLDAVVPTCPQWRLRDLLRHQGEVHRWAGGHVSGQRLTPMSAEDAQALTSDCPDADDDLLAWFRAGHAELVQTLSTADPEMACWSFLPAPSPLRFWARRQAHETAIHRVDAQSVGGQISGFDTAFAADGVDELLYAFFARPGRLRSEQPYTMALTATDTDRGWTVRVGTDGAVTSDGAQPADCAVSATASELYLLLWNRRDSAGLAVSGDTTALAHWREHAHIR